MNLQVIQGLTGGVTGDNFEWTQYPTEFLNSLMSSEMPTQFKFK